MSQSYLYALLGGIIIGLSAAGMLWANGKILGVSGIVGGSFRAKSWDLFWRVAFLVGLLVGSLFIEPLGFSVMSIEVNRSLGLIAVGGLLVGFGTTIGNGCTSGHGVCGVSRLSPRSILATIAFILSGIFSVALLDHWIGGGL